MSKDEDDLDLVADAPEVPGEVQDAGDPIGSALAKVNVTNAVLAKLKADAEAFPVPKVGDKEGYEKIRRHRLDIVPLRTTTVKVLKAMREEAVAFQKKVVGKENEIVAALQAAEAIDQAKEDSYLAALKAIQDEKDRIEKDRVDGLLIRLAVYNWTGNILEVAQDTPSQFEARLEEAKKTFELIEAGKKAEAERMAKEETDRLAREAAIKAEEERQAKVRAEQEASAAELKRAQEAFEKQQRDAKEAFERTERERLAKVAEDERKAREAAEAETLRLKTEAAMKLKAEEDVKAAEAEKARLAALAPDKEKIVEWTRKSWQSVNQLPTIRDEALDAMLTDAAKSIAAILDGLRLTVSK